MRRPRTVGEAFTYAKRTGRPYVIRLDRDALYETCEQETCAREFRRATHVAYLANGTDAALCAAHARNARTVKT